MSNIKRAYDAEGNKAYVYSILSAIFTDEKETKTAEEFMEELSNNVSDLSKSISNLDDKKVSIESILKDFKILPSDIENYILSAELGLNMYQNGLIYKGELTTKDLNNVTASGIFYIKDATGFTNIPTELTTDIDNSMIIVFGNSEQIIQKIIRLDGQGTYLRTKPSSTADWINWNTYLLVNTNVKNKPKTTLTLDNSMGTVNYFIEDGWCTCEFKDISGSTADIDIMETEELPTPNLTQPCTLENNGVMVGTIYISGRDAGKGVKITAHKNSASLGYGTVNYKIDQSKY